LPFTLFHFLLLPGSLRSKPPRAAVYSGRRELTSLCFSFQFSMSLLDQLWDDTVAGPRPDTGLGKLRKHRTFSFRSTAGNGSVKSYGGGGDEASAAVSEESTRVTRSIMIVRPPGYQSGSPPVSPAGSTPPVSPFSGKTVLSFFLFCKQIKWTLCS
ncbi:Dormancy-associated protein homolog 3, partial [Linum perenne]